MTWYDTYEEIIAKYPDTVFEEYWLTKDDVNKLREHKPVEKGRVTINMDFRNILSVISKKNDDNERRILLHIGILSPFNDDPVIIIKQKEV